VQAQQRKVLVELVEALVQGGPGALSQVMAEQWHQAGDDAGRMRVIIDQVAQLTDSAALSWHRRLTASA
jgi:dGTPase